MSHTCPVQFSLSVVSDSLQPHGLQHTRPPCPSPVPGVYSNSCPLSQWCHPIISSSVIPFHSHLQCFPSSGFLQMSQLFASGGQSIGVSASTSALSTEFKLSCCVIIRLRNVEGKKRCPFLLLENSRPLSLLREPQAPFSSSGTPDFLSTCTGIGSLNLSDFLYTL